MTKKTRGQKHLITNQKQMISDLNSQLHRTRSEKVALTNKIEFIEGVLNLQPKKYYEDNKETIEHKIGELIETASVVKKQTAEIESLKTIIAMALLKTNRFYPTRDEDRPAQQVIKAGR